MATVFLIHRWFGGLILPLLMLGAAIWFTAAYRPERWPGKAAQVFRVLVDVQFMLGLSFWVYLVFFAGAGARYLSFPFLFHPMLGLLAATVAKLALRPGRVTRRLGRWAPLATLGLMLTFVLAAGTLARMI